MNHYEAVYIVHPALQEGRLNDIVGKFHNKLTKLKGEILYVENWGKKKLAYAIDKQKYGTYILCQYSLGGEYIKELSQEFELNPNILRYLITKIENSDIKEGSNQLEIKEKNDTTRTEKSNGTKSPNQEAENKKSAEEITEEQADENKIKKDA